MKRKEKKELFWWAELLRWFESARASSPQRVSAQQIVQVAHLLLHPAVSRAATFEAVAVKFSAKAPERISSEDQVPRCLQVINSHVKSHIMRPSITHNCPGNCYFLSFQKKTHTFLT